jgi:hypothetical protein
VVANNSVVDVDNLVSDFEKMEILFSGDADGMGGLSNEEDLVRLCPKEFNMGNSWCVRIYNMTYEVMDTHSWKWREKNPDKQKHQLDCLKNMMSSLFVPFDEKVAVGGWMLSKMLLEIPF